MNIHLLSWPAINDQWAINDKVNSATWTDHHSTLTVFLNGQMNKTILIREMLFCIILFSSDFTSIRVSTYMYYNNPPYCFRTETLFIIPTMCVFCLGYGLFWVELSSNQLSLRYVENIITGVWHLASADNYCNPSIKVLISMGCEINCCSIQQLFFYIQSNQRRKWKKGRVAGRG